MKTNASRLLDQLGIEHELREYEVNLQDLTAETVAAKIGLPLEQVFKTLVVEAANQSAYFAVLPGNAELDLKALARLTGARRLALAALKDLQNLTGYIRGGVTALAAKKVFPVYVDENIFSFDLIAVSAGVRGTQMLLRPSDYVTATQAKLGPISKIDTSQPRLKPRR